MLTKQQMYKSYAAWSSSYMKEWHYEYDEVKNKIKYICNNNKSLYFYEELDKFIKTKQLKRFLLAHKEYEDLVFCELFSENIGE